MAVLGAFSLVTNGCFAPLLLKEKVTRNYVYASLIIVIGR